MSRDVIDRRTWLGRSLSAGVGTGALVAALDGNQPLAGAAETEAAEPAKVPAAQQFAATTPAPAVGQVRYCLNTATLRGRQLPIQELVSAVAAAGYDGIEVWIDELDRHVAAGGDLDQLGRQIADLGLKVEGAIAFANWLETDPQRWATQMEQARRDMDKVAAIGGAAIAAPPVGQNDRPIADWGFAADRFQRLIEIGRDAGVQPQLEVWGFSQAIGTLSQAMQLALQLESRDYGLLLDVYHLYKGGSPFSGLRWIHAAPMALFHINDYPAEPGLAEIADRDRVFPGDGVAPLGEILGDLAASGFAGALSLELFNPDYWQREPQWVLETGLAKTKAAWEARNGQ